MELIIAALVVLVALVWLFIVVKRATTAWRKKRKVAKAENEIRNAAALIDMNGLVHDFLHSGRIDLNLHLDCRELNHSGIDRAIEYLGHSSIDDGELPEGVVLARRLLLGLCYIRKKDFRTAIEFLAELEGTTAMWRAYCYDELKEYLKAIEILQEFPEEHVDSKLLLAMNFAKLGKHELGIDLLKKKLRNKKLLDSQTEKLRFLLVLGDVYEEAGYFHKALKCYEQVCIEDINYDTGDGISILEKIDSFQNKYFSDKNDRNISREVRIEVWRRDRGRCAECGSQRNLEYDHIIPVSKGGSNTTRNIRLLCEECNRKKSDSI